MAIFCSVKKLKYVIYRQLNKVIASSINIIQKHHTIQWKRIYCASSQYSFNSNVVVVFLFRIWQNIYIFSGGL